MHLKYRNVNDAFEGIVGDIFSGKILVNVEASRYGEVIRIPEPVIITYSHPRERVLFNSARDANPFFHLFESLWMLAGRNDVQSLVFYNSKMIDFSDGGKTFHGAYGDRWINHFVGLSRTEPVNQLNIIIEHLRETPTSRRMVLAIWDPEFDLSYAATKGTKDVPCNLDVLFEIEDERFVNMTVFNRSNDLVWGALGANVVHFSFLQEYVACSLGLKVGQYHQISNNLHAYTERWKPELWLAGEKNRTMHSPPVLEYASNIEDQTVHGGILPSDSLLGNKGLFDREVKEFIDRPLRECETPFLNRVARPMCQAFAHYKALQFGLAHEAMKRVQSEDWKVAGEQWILRRATKLERKSNPYTVRK